MRKNTKTATATATNDVATATIPASPENCRWRITALSATVDGGAATLTVLSGATLVWTAEVGPNAPLHLPCSIQAPAASEELTAELTAAGTDNVGTVSIAAELES